MNGFHPSWGFAKGKEKRVKRESSARYLLNGIVVPKIGDAIICPNLPPMLGPSEMGRLMVRDLSLFGETNIEMSERLTGKGANARLSSLMKPILNGMEMHGRVSLHSLMRMTAIMREMVTIVRKPAVAAAGGLPLFVLPQKDGTGIGLGPHTVSIRKTVIADSIMMGHRAGVKMTGIIFNGRNKMSDPRTDVMRNISDVGSADDVPTLVSPFA